MSQFSASPYLLNPKRSEEEARAAVSKGRMVLPAKCTPGPWRYFPHAGSAFYIHSESDPIAARVASVLYTSGAHSFHEADARLIAGAPELFAALTRYVRDVDDYVSNHDGHYPEESDMPDCGCIECSLGTVPNNRNTGLCTYHQARAALAKVGT